MGKSITIFILLLLAATLVAQADNDTIRFTLLDAAEYDLDMFYSTDLGRLFMQVDFDIPKSELNPKLYYGVFLEQHSYIQSVTVSGFYEGNYLVQNLDANHFEPVLPKPELLYADSPARFYGINLNHYADYPETAHFRIWYYTEVPAFTLNDRQQLSTGLRGDQFWYPRSLKRNNTVRLTLTTTPYLTLLVGNSYAAKTDEQYTRIHKETFIETAEQPVSFALIRD